MRSIVCALLVACLVLAAPARALPPCTPGWIPVGADGDVTALGVWNNRVVAGGSFTQIGGVDANGVAWFDGLTWHAFGAGLAGGKVLALAEFQGQLYAGGEFSNSGGVSTPYLARWNGTTWSSIPGGPGGGPVDTLCAVESQVVRGATESRMYVGGRFTTILGFPVPYFAYWNGSFWNAPPDKPNGPVYRISIVFGQVAVMGAYTQLGASPSSRLATFLPDTSTWSTNTSLIMNGALRDLIFESGGPAPIYSLAGEFSTLNASTALRVAQPFGPPYSLGAGFNSTVRDLETTSTALYAAGDFTFTGVTPLVGFARFDSAGGGAWVPVSGGVNGSCWALLEFGGELWVGGQFLTAGGVPSRGIARYNETTAPSVHTLPQGQNVASYDALQLQIELASGYPGPYTYQWYLNNAPLASGIQGSGAEVTDATSSTLQISEITPSEQGQYKVTISGPCGVVYESAPVQVNVIPPGPCTPDWVQGFPTSPQLNGPVRAVLAWNDDDFSGTPARTIFAGNFAKLGGDSFLRVGEWTGEEFVLLGEGFNKSVNALAQFDFDGPGGAATSLVAAGEFTKSGLTTINRVARWNGSAWEPIGLGFNGTVNALFVFDFDGPGGLPSQLVAAGAFSKSGATSVSRIARWDGTQWRPLGAGLNNTVFALENWVPTGDTQDRLVAGGAFTKSGTAKVNRVAYFDGNQWVPVGAGFNNTVNALGEFNFTLYAAGAFTKSGSDSVNRIASFDGTDWLQLGEGFDGPVLALNWIDLDGLGPAGKVLFAGGSFKKSGAASIARVASFDGENWQPVGAGADGVVRTLSAVRRPDGQPGTSALVIGGDFKIVDGLTQRALGAYRCPVQNLLALRQAGLPMEAAPARACSIADIAGPGGLGTPPDGQVTGDDVVAFFQAFMNDDVTADVAGAEEGPDFEVNADDVIAFVSAVGSGC